MKSAVLVLAVKPLVLLLQYVAGVCHDFLGRSVLSCSVEFCRFVPHLGVNIAELPQFIIKHTIP